MKLSLSTHPPKSTWPRIALENRKKNMCTIFNPHPLWHLLPSCSSSSSSPKIWWPVATSHIKQTPIHIIWEYEPKALLTNPLTPFIPFIPAFSHVVAPTKIEHPPPPPGPPVQQNPAHQPENSFMSPFFSFGKTTIPL